MAKNGVGGPATWYLETKDEALVREILDYLNSIGKGDTALYPQTICADGLAHDLIEVTDLILARLRKGGRKEYVVWCRTPKDEKPRKSIIHSEKPNKKVAKVLILILSGCENPIPS